MTLPPDVLTTWAGGQLLAFSGLDGATDYHDGLTLRTTFERPGLDIRLPGDGAIRFDEPLSEHARLAGDWFVVSLRLRGVFVDAYHVLLDGPCEVRLSSDRLVSRSDGNHTLVGVKTRYEPELLSLSIEDVITARRAWLEQRKLPATLSRAQTRCVYKALSQIKTMVYSPEPPFARRFTTPDRWPHRGTWLWDSAFHAAGIRHVDIALARDTVRAVLDGQRDDGFVPCRCDPSGQSPHATQPPLLTMAVDLLQQMEPDTEWLAEIYPRLSAYIEWDLRNRDSDGHGLLEWLIEGDPRCRSGESGMDNSPRFDDAVQLDAPDFNAFVAHECELLAGFADELGKADEATRWRSEHSRLCELINGRLWNAEHGLYVDYDVKRQRRSNVLASAGFLPLICGAPSPEQARRLADTLADPSLFGTPLPVPSIAARDTAHYEKDMWRGPVWVNVNWLIARGFERYGMLEQAAMIREQTTAEIERCVESHGTFFEFYDDRREVDPPRLHRKGCCAPERSPFHQVFFDYGWTATLYLDMVLTEKRSRLSRRHRDTE